MKLVLTDKRIAALKPAEPGKRYAVADAAVPGFGVRVTDRGHKTFVIGARIAGAKNHTSREIAEVGAISLPAAREKARELLLTIKAGKDPRQEEARNRADLFGAVAEQYILRHVRKHRRAKMSEREIRTDLIKPWANRPFASIERRDVVTLIEAIVDRPAPAQARNALGHLKALYNWAINRDLYGVEHSPCDRVKPRQLIGEKKPRLRVLSDEELRRLWLATIEIGYPLGHLVQLLMLTGCRKSEVAGARWSEFGNDVWTIPSERYKADAQHVIPLSDDLRAVLAALPRWTGGDFLFSTTNGEKPVNSFSKAKLAFDKAVRMDNATPATEPKRKRKGERIKKAKKLKPADHWTFHDIRRTMRTRLSQLRIPEQVAEMVIGHAKKGLARVYDQHEFKDEIAEALRAWHSLLRAIVAGEPAPNVVSFRARAEAS